MSVPLWIVILAILALWDTGRRFAARGAWCTNDEYEELTAWIEGMSDEAKTAEVSRTATMNAHGVSLDALADRMGEVQERLDFEAKARVDLLARMDAQGKQLTNFGLSAEARKAALAAAQGRAKIIR